MKQLQGGSGLKGRRRRPVILGKVRMVIFKVELLGIS